jgi:hypothetical protein
MLPARSSEGRSTGTKTVTHSTYNALQSGPVASAMILCLAVGMLRADEQLQIVSPNTIYAGASLAVTVNTTGGVLQSVSIAGDRPFELTTCLTAPPYKYSYTIPANFPSGRYKFKAVGVTAPGATIFSDQAEVDVEQVEKPKKLQSEFVSLTVGEHENVTLVIWGIFADGGKVDLTRSTQISYISDHPPVAEISAEGSVKGVSAGKAKITAKYADRTIVVPVSVVAQGQAQ